MCLISKDEAGNDRCRRSASTSSLIRSRWATTFDALRRTCLGPNGRMVIVGAHRCRFPGLHRRRARHAAIAQSGDRMIGGLPETQEMLDFCGESWHSSGVGDHRAQTRSMRPKRDRMKRGDVRYRFVIDASTIGEAA